MGRTSIWFLVEPIPSLFSLPCYMQKRTPQSLVQLQENAPVVPLIIVLELPLHVINFIIEPRELSVSNMGTTFICIALIIRHLNRQHHCFSFLCPVIKVKRSKLPYPTLIKAVEASYCSPVRSAFTDVAISALSFFFYRKTFRMLNIQILCWTIFRIMFAAFVLVS